MASDADSTQRPVAVAIANEAYCDQARALFAALHTVAGWQGDYLLLGVGLSDPQAAWFTERGIVVQDAGPVLPKADERLSVLLTKLRLFEPTMRQWSHVVYLDCDIIIRGRLDRLTRVDGFHAVRGIARRSLAPRFKTPGPDAPPDERALYEALQRRFDLKAPGFNGGVYAFSTDVIEPSTFEDLVALAHDYEPLISDEESVLGLHFLGRWRELPLAYNTFVHHLKLARSPAAPGMLLHFVNGMPPWREASPFHAEWRRHLEQAPSLDFRSPWPQPTGLSALPLSHRLQLASRYRAYRTAHAAWHMLPESLKDRLRRLR